MPDYFSYTLKIKKNTGRFEKIRKYEIFIILGLFFIVGLTAFIINYNANPGWDESVYIGMGKYIYSGGESGLFEVLRPPVLPLIFGLFWKIGLNEILFARLFEILCYLGSIYLTYIIAKKIFDKNTALFSAVLLAISPIFFIASQQMLSGLPSLFFGLVAIYFLIEKRYLLSGIFAALCFLTRFPHGIIMLCAFIFIVILVIRKEAKIKDALWYILGTAIIIIPYLAVIQIKYGNFLLPLQAASAVIKTAGLWIYGQPWIYYFTGLFFESVVLIFFIIGAYYAVARKNKLQMLLLSLVVIAFIYFETLAHKEMRFMIILLPFAYMMSVFGIVQLMNIKRIKKYKKIIVACIVLIVAAVLLFQAGNYIKKVGFRHVLTKDDFYLNKNVTQFASQTQSENVWISNPAHIVYSDKKAGKLMYLESLSSLNSKLDEPDAILMNTCDLDCPPDNIQCNKEMEELISGAKAEMKVYYHKEGNCEEYIFVR